MPQTLGACLEEYRSLAGLVERPSLEEAAPGALRRAGHSASMAWTTSHAKGAKDWEDKIKKYHAKRTEADQRGDKEAANYWNEMLDKAMKAQKATAAKAAAPTPQQQLSRMKAEKELKKLKAQHQLAHMKAALHAAPA
jgi:hypothetical protein